MEIRNIEIQNLRNLKKISLFPSSGLNFIVGENGEGKSSFLESIYIMGNLKSFKTSRIRECINWDEQFFFIRGKTDLHIQAIYLNRAGDKKVSLNGKRVPPLEYLKNISVIGFFPQEEFKIFQSFSEIRSLIDRGIFNIDKEYLLLYKAFLHHLENRNILLKAKKKDEKLFKIVTEKFIETSTKIDKKREEFLEEIKPVFSDIVRRISENKWNITFSYFPSKYTKEKAIEEEEKGFSLFGAHRGRILFELNGKKMRSFASQGQIKVALFAFKLSLIRLLKRRGTSSIFLIDDIGGEVDIKRRSFLIEFLLEEKIQSFVTSAIPLYIENATVFQVKKGKIWKSQ